MVLGRRALLLSGAALPLTGCGFALRRAPELQFRTLQLVGFGAGSALAEELRRSVNASSTTLVVDAPAAAAVQLQALTDAREKSVVASTAAGQVREVQVRARLKFSLRTPSGRELIAPTEIVLSRDLSYNENVALAKEQEEALLYRAMQTDIVAQVMRRLASVAPL
jgi:LPS-assembly lipoprotein